MSYTRYSIIEMNTNYHVNSYGLGGTHYFQIVLTRIFLYSKTDQSLINFNITDKLCLLHVNDCFSIFPSPLVAIKTPHILGYETFN